MNTKLEELQKELAVVKAERNAAIAFLSDFKICGTCKHFERKRCGLDKTISNDGNWAGCRKWSWKGIIDTPYFRKEEKLKEVIEERDALIAFLEDYNILWNHDFPKFAREEKDKGGQTE